MINQPSTKFGVYRHCGSGGMFLVAEEEESRSSCSNLSLLVISKRHGLKAHGNPL